MRTFQVKTKEVSLACALRGKTGVPLVFMHGLSANRMCFQFLEEAMHQSLPCKTLTYDLRGRGRSEKPPGQYGPAVHAADLHALLSARALSKFTSEKPVLIAHSLGAYAALHYAAEHSDSLGGLVLLDGGGPLNRGEALRIYMLLRMSFIRLGRRFKSEDAYLDLVRKSPLVKKWNPQMEALLRYDMVTDADGTGLNLPVHVVESELTNAGGSLSALKAIKGLWKFGFPAPDYSRIQCPVLVVRAVKRNLFPGDSVLSRRSLAELKMHLPQTNSIEVNANHYSILLENQPALNEGIAGFLRGLSPSRVRKTGKGRSVGAGGRKNAKKKAQARRKT